MPCPLSQLSSIAAVTHIFALSITSAMIGLGVLEQLTGMRLNLGDALGGLAVRGADELRVALGEDGLHGRRGDRLVLLPREPARHVALEAHDAALPHRALEHLGYDLREPLVAVGDHAPDALDAASAQAAQERLP